MTNPHSDNDPIRTRVSDLLGVLYPIVQAPMGWIARSQLASAVSNAGGLGIIETSSGELDVVKDEIRRMRDLTDKPFGVNIAQLFVRDPGIVDFVVGQGVKFVTTSAGDPRKYTAALKGAGLTVFHVVPSLDAALKVIDAGVDGLVVEGGEGGGFKNPRDVATMVLLPLVRSRAARPATARRRQLTLLGSASVHVRGRLDHAESRKPGGAGPGSARFLRPIEGTIVGAVIS
jgi:enoyl-[acyl-carrier protein] reductase II